MNRSTPLSPDARRLLELGSQVEPPTAEQIASMDRALAPLFRAGRAEPASGAASALSGSEPRAASPEKRATQTRPAARRAPRALESLSGPGSGKLWLAFGALAATAGASFWLGRSISPTPDLAALRTNVAASVAAAEPAAVDAAAVAVNAPLGHVGARGGRTLLAPAPVAETSVPFESETPSAAQIPEAPRAASRSVAAARATSMPMLVSAERPPLRPVERARGQGSLGLAGEIEQLAGVEAALRQGSAQRALLLLEQRSVHHLLEQAAALRAIAECELGRSGAAQGAREVLARWPASAFQLRISNACGL